VNPVDKAPNFFIIGAAKAGTTSLYDILYQHPQVYLPFDKEPSFFSDDTYFSRGHEWYIKTYFKKAYNYPLRGEATSRYLYFGKKVAPRIYGFSQPEFPKFIVIFRDPAKLVYSYYWNSVREGRESLPFKAALLAEQDRMTKLKIQMESNGQMSYAYSRIGSYASQIMQYLKLFPIDRFLFLLTEDLMDFSSLVTNLQTFLGVKEYSVYIKPMKSNVSALPKSRKVHQLLRNRSVLKDIVKPFVPYPIRHKLKISALEINLRRFTPPELDAEIANSIREHYSEETKRLQDIIQRDLTNWLPV